MKNQYTVNRKLLTVNRKPSTVNRQPLTVNRKGMELSVNFLVIIIISIVLFGMSLYFINPFRQVGAGYEASLDSYAVEQLRSLSRDKSFGLYPAEVKLGVGGSEVIGVGVTNNGPAG